MCVTTHWNSFNAFTRRWVDPPVNYCSEDKKNCSRDENIAFWAIKLWGFPVSCITDVKITTFSKHHLSFGQNWSDLKLFRNHSLKLKRCRIQFHFQWFYSLKFSEISTVFSYPNPPTNVTNILFPSWKLRKLQNEYLPTNLIRLKLLRFPLQNIPNFCCN